MIASLNGRTNLQARVLAGSFVLLLGSGSVTALSFAYNISVARFLGPAGFGDASVVYTLLILISAVTLSFQIVTAKVVAQQASTEARSAVYRAFHGTAWKSGLLIALLLLLFRRTISTYLHLPGSDLVVWLAVAVAFYVPLGSRRGFLQGNCNFRRLAANMVLEGASRLCGSLLFIALGFGVAGVIAANACGIAIAYYFALPALPARAAYDLLVPDAFREALQAIVFFAGQVVINNCDIAVVKHFFPPNQAGIYAAAALVGRVISSFSWAVVHTMFPVSAGAQPQDRKDPGVLRTALLLVSGLGSVMALILWLAPARIWTVLFGPQFVLSSQQELPRLLGLYAATTCVYSLCVVMIAYEMSHRIANTGWVQLGFSGVLVVSIYLFHSSLEQVVWVQLVMLTLLLGIVAVPYLRSVRPQWEEKNEPPILNRVRTVRRVSEDEVIVEFLKNDSYNPEFAEYQEPLAALVASPDFSDPTENARRRALLFVRHGALWRELPKDTEWFEVELRVSDLGNIQVFPRAQWRKLAHGDFSIARALHSLETGRCHNVGEAFLAKIWDLGDWLTRNSHTGAVLLIGRDESGPLTILDGNHRLVAAALKSPAAIERFRFFAGLSPNMARCCWYKTNLLTLSHYAVNLLRHLVYDPEAELAQVLKRSAANLRAADAGFRRAEDIPTTGEPATGDVTRVA